MGAGAVPAQDIPIRRSAPAASQLGEQTLSILVGRASPLRCTTRPTGRSPAGPARRVRLQGRAGRRTAMCDSHALPGSGAGPGALLRYWRAGRLGGPLVRLLISGAVPGVVIGAVIRVFAVPGLLAFHLLILMLLPLGLGLWTGTWHQPAATRQPSLRAATALAWPSAFPENAASLALHQCVGFRVIGTRERIGHYHGRRRHVVLVERRSPPSPEHRRPCSGSFGRLGGSTTACTAPLPLASGRCRPRCASRWCPRAACRPCAG